MRAELELMNMSITQAHEYLREREQVEDFEGCAGIKKAIEEYENDLKARQAYIKRGTA